MDSSLVREKLIDSFEVRVIVVGFRAASLTKLAGRGLGMVPDRQTTGQLTLTTGEAGLGHRARLETSNVPFMSHKKKDISHTKKKDLSITPSHRESGRPLLALPSSFSLSPI